MIRFSRFTLPNGLKVIHHEDHSTPLVCLNILYDVGARDEDPARTGFAHLFEHLMFGGSVHIPSYDEPLQRVGGENNAFTTNDLTNYYLTVPANNIETGYWLESDRMLSLAFSEKSLEVQRSVVIEEFKQRYLNQPYGDVWLLLRPLAYKVHPYQWDTIGKEIRHIEEASMADVRQFFDRHYRPNNAILVTAGNMSDGEARRLAEKWFGDLPKGAERRRKLPKEPAQTEARFLEVFRNVPANAIYKVWHMPDRLHPDYHAHDLLSDILSRGQSSRLFNRLVKEKKIFSEINAFITGDVDEGLFVINGKIHADKTPEEADAAIEDEIQKLVDDIVPARELEKVRNKAESTLVFSEMSVMNKAMNLAIMELLGDAGNVNTEADKYRAVTAEQIRNVAERLFRVTNCSTMYYRVRK
ncbi:MAG: insulinase family protein [Bacteroidia bacterium]|nr:insulinase family protein [Bacteroidia bacterium]